MKTKQTKEEIMKDKRFIRIQSTRTICVAPGLQCIGVTNKDAHVENRFKINSMWQNSRVKIMNGAGYYPNCIKDWDAVKSLEKLGILSIGEETDTIADDSMRTVAEAIEKKLLQADSKYRAQLDASLNDPNAEATEKKKNAIRRNIGLLKPQPAALVQEGAIIPDTPDKKGE